MEAPTKGKDSMNIPAVKNFLNFLAVYSIINVKLIFKPLLNSTWCAHKGAVLIFQIFCCLLIL